MTRISNRLAVLASEIRAEHEAAQRSRTDAAEHAYAAGERLAEAKADEAMPQRGWKRWVEQEAGVPLSTADQYVSIFRSVEKQLLSIGDIAGTSLIAACKLASARQAEARREASRNAEPLPDGMDLRIGDCRTVLADIADNSVPLILTDPPWRYENPQWAAPGGENGSQF